MNYQLDKHTVRETVREAFDLYTQERISRDILDTIATSALAWEISVSLLEKMRQFGYKRNGQKEEHPRL